MDNATEITLEEITELLDAAGLDYEHTGRMTDEECIDLPGYGRIWHEDAEQQGTEGGWLVDNYRGDVDPVDSAELREEIVEFCETWKQSHPRT